MFLLDILFAFESLCLTLALVSVCIFYVYKSFKLVLKNKKKLKMNFIIPKV